MAQDAKKGFLLYYDYRKHLALLNDEERGKLLMALLDYGEHGTQPELEGAALMAFSFIQAQMDRDAEKYAETVKASAFSNSSRKASSVRYFFQRPAISFCRLPSMARSCG